jgi:hypothetical protein
MTLSRRLAGLASIAVLLAGCAATAAGTPAPASPSSEATSPSPAATSGPAAASPSAAPSAATGRTLVSGRMVCQFLERAADASPFPSPTTFPHGLVREWYDLDCWYFMSDQRVSGDNEYLYDAIEQELKDLPAVVSIWEDIPMVLTNQGGTWKGRGTGLDYIHADTVYTLGYATYEGQGAYAGLTYTLQFSRKLTTMTNEPYLVSGWIEPAK